MIIKNKNQRLLLRHIILILSFMALSYLSISILFKTQTIYGAYDIQFHLKRMRELLYAIQHHIIPLYSFNEFHGASSMILYPYISIIPLAFLKYLCRSYVTSIYLYFMFINLLALMVSFYSSLSISKDKWTSYLFSVIYTFSIPLLNNEFTNMDIGASFAIAILPLSIFGYLEWIKNNHWVELSFGIILLAFSHVLSLSIIVMFIVLWSFINLKKINKVKMINALKSLLLIILITSFEWIPLIKYAYFNLKNTYPTPLPNKLSGIPMITFLKPNFSVTNFGYGLIFIIAVILSSLFYKKFNILVKQMYWLSLLIVFIGSKLFPWGFSLFKVFKIYQYTSRFYIIPRLLLSFIISLIITKYFSKFNKYNLITLSIIILSVFNQMTFQHNIISRNNGSSYFTSNLMTHISYNGNGDIHHNHIKLNDYIMPLHKSKFTNEAFTYYKLSTNNQVNKFINTNFNELDYAPINSLSKINYINNNKGIYDGNCSLVVHHCGFNKFKFTNKKYINKFSLPLVKYNGEKLRVCLDHHLIKYSNRKGMVTINNVKSGNHVMYIKYIHDNILFLLEIILFVLGIFWVIIIFINRIFETLFYRFKN